MSTVAKETLLALPGVALIHSADPISPLNRL